MNIPDDIDRIATDIAKAEYGKTGDEPQYELYLSIANALTTERQRCSGICDAEIEWCGDIRDVVARINSGEQPRQIPGWNCPSEED